MNRNLVIMLQSAKHIVIIIVHVDGPITEVYQKPLIYPTSVHGKLQILYESYISSKPYSVGF